MKRYYQGEGEAFHPGIGYASYLGLGKFFTRMKYVVSFFIYCRGNLERGRFFTPGDNGIFKKTHFFILLETA